MKKTMFSFSTLAMVAVSGFAQQNQDSADQKPVQQLEEVVVTDSRFALKRENSGKTIITISSEEIQQNTGKTLGELLQEKSGIEINGSNNVPGKDLGLYIRGGRSSQVLILVDGVVVSDPSQGAGVYDLRLLSLQQIESVEISKGAASTLYGSGGVTAVIQITTKKASSKAITADFSSSIGTNQSKEDQNYDGNAFENAVQLSGKLNKFSYIAGFTHQNVKGLSQAASTAQEQDPYSNHATNLKLGYQFTENLGVQVYGNTTAIKSDYDASAFLDAPNRFLSKQERVGFSTNYNYTNGSIIANAAYSAYDREFISNYPNTYTAENYVADVYNKYTFFDKLHTVVGVNAINNKAEFGQAKEFTIIDPYANAVYISDFGLQINAGVRLNNHSNYGNNLVYNVNPSYVLPVSEKDHVKILASYATSFIAPSLSQLHGAWGANPDLNPEKSATMEAGAELTLKNTLTLSALYFRREEKSKIGYTTGYVNLADRLKTEGVELEARYTPIKDVQVSGNYTFTSYMDAIAFRIPKHKINAKLAYQISDKTFASLSYQYNDDRAAQDFSSWPASIISLKSYQKVNGFVNHKLSNKVTVFAGIDNIFNQEIIDVYGYTARGRNVRAGFQISL